MPELDAEAEGPQTDNLHSTSIKKSGALAGFRKTARCHQGLDRRVPQLANP